VIARLTALYVALFAAVLGALSWYAYWLIGTQYKGMLAPALGTPEGQAGYAAAMRHVALAIGGADVPLLIGIGIIAYLLARWSLRPLIEARAREQQFAADAAHELRSPLATIASVAQAARLRAEPETRDALDTISRTAVDASNLIGDLLTLARDPRPGLIQCEPVDLANVVESCAREFDTRFTQAGKVLDVYANSGIVDGDERRLRELVRNLLENALKHADKRARVECGADGRNAYIRVEDDGDGVADALRDRIFERNVRGDAGGSGLGLAIAKWIASAHGGSLALAGNDASRARGAAFVASFPVIGAN
jgi:signal transduction histidine kinase